MAERTTVTVTQEVKELVFDVQNKAFLTGQAREAEGTNNYESASNMQASDDEENLYQIKRSLSNAFSTLKVTLSEYLTEEGTTSNNKIPEAIDSDGTLTISLSLPSNYNKAAADSLGNNIHSYLVDLTLGDWFAITNKKDAADYISHAEVSAENIKRALYNRKRPARPTYV